MPALDFEVYPDIDVNSDTFCAGDIVRVTAGGLNGGAQGTVLDADPRHPGWVRVHLTGGPVLFFRPERLRLHHPVDHLHARISRV